MNIIDYLPINGVGYLPADGISYLSTDGINCLLVDKVSYLLADEFPIIKRKNYKLTSYLICISAKIVTIIDVIAELIAAAITCWVVGSIESILIRKTSI